MVGFKIEDPPVNYIPNSSRPQSQIHLSIIPTPTYVL